jgi:glyoxylase-like metal-dependent hydrolase (beta-lactamase superfamily II)
VTTQRWQVGDVEIVRIPDDDFPLPSEQPVPEWAVPHLAPDTSAFYLAFTAFGIAARDRRIVVDPWLANDAVRWLPDAADRAERLLGALADAGFPADEVDTVVNSHVDGWGWNTRPDGEGGWRPSFPNARYLLARAELDAVARHEPLFGGLDLADLLDAGVVDAVDPPLELTDGVRLVDAPGHNFGHLAVRIESQGELAVIPGHLFLTILEVADPTSRPQDPPEVELTRDAVLAELADRGGLLLSPLFGGAGGGVVQRGADGYEVATP